MRDRIRKTKIVATLGPASSSAETIAKLLQAGVNVFRLNFSHGSHEEHRAHVDTIRDTAARLDMSYGILADLQGPKIRTGRTPGDAPVSLRTGARVTIVSRRGPATAEHISVDYPKLAREARPGQRVLINDGAIRLKVTAVRPNTGELDCRVVYGGQFSSRKGVNLPDTVLSVPAMTAKDRRDAAFALSLDVHYIALSFVRRAADLAPLRRLIGKQRGRTKLIAKIEKPEAAAGVAEIFDVCDGIMVARGDLGVETSAEQVPILQKDLVAGSAARGKLVIVATQMLESMIHSASPTRAESSDVANAILDGTDAVMLSGETAVGEYPVRAVDTMVRIARTTESSRYYPVGWTDLSVRDRYPPYTVCEAAATASRDFGDIPVLVFTVSGETALYLSKIRNASPIYAFSPESHVVQMLSLAWNVHAFELPLFDDSVALQGAAEDMLVTRGLLKSGDYVIVISGTAGARGATNQMRIKCVGED